MHEYEYSGNKLFYEKRGDTRFYYRYDINGNIAAITRYNAEGDKFTLYVICNSRGDVEELRQTDGTLYARYVYDTWGNTLHIYDANGTEITYAENLAVQNPFRYRGYYYDAESGLYYLQSRYYDPVTCRFVNCDSLVDTSDVLGFNMYAYCGNNPVIYVDPTGYVANFVNSFTSEMKSVWIKGYNYVSEAESYADFSSLNKINPDDYDDDSYYNNNDRLRGRDSKRYEKKQIDRAFGKRKDSEQERRDLHKGKRNEGKRNDDNFSNDDFNKSSFL